jgi:hypothetical protein
MKLLTRLPESATVGDMKPGDVAVILDGSYAGELVALFGEGKTTVLISLNSIEHFWHNPSQVSFKIKVLPKGTTLTLEV